MTLPLAPSGFRFIVPATTFLLVSAHAGSLPCCDLMFTFGAEENGVYDALLEVIKPAGSRDCVK